MKLLSFIILIPCFLFFSTNEKKIVQTEITPHTNQPCRLEKVFINDTLLHHQYHYNDESKLIQIDIYSEDKLQSIFSLDYDKSSRISVVEYSYVSHHGDSFFQTYDVEYLDYFIHQKNKYTYKYHKKNPTQINFRKSYSGYEYPESITESDLKRNAKHECIYNSENQLIKIKNITKYRGKKKVNKSINSDWYEFDYDGKGNLNKIVRVIENDFQDTIFTHSTERSYDSFPSLQFNYFDFMHFPSVFQYNNIIHEKYERLGKDTEIIHEFKFTHEYNEEGLVLKTTKEIVHDRYEKHIGEIDVFIYEYTCE